MRSTMMLRAMNGFRVIFGCATDPTRCYGAAMETPLRFPIIYSGPVGFDMPSKFTIHAIKGSERKRVPGATATEAVLKRSVLLRQGWGVSTSDYLRIPISDARVDAQAKEEEVQKV